MLRLTGKQSKSARSLLKWNLYDLGNRVKGVVPKRIGSFEHGLVHLMEWENDELVRAFKKAGILFKGDLEVVLDKSKPTQDAGSGGGMHGEGERIVLRTEQVLELEKTAEEMERAGSKADEAHSTPDRKEKKSGS